MKKIINISILIIIALSLIPAVFAQEAPLLEDAEETVTDLEPREGSNLREQGTINVDKLAKREDSIRDRLQRAEQFRRARVDESRMAGEAVRQGLKEATSCEDDATRATCPAVGNVADTLTKISDRVEEVLSKVRAHAEENERTALASKVEGYEQELETYRAVFANEEATKAEVWEAGKGLKSLMKDLSSTAKEAFQDRVETFYNRVIEKARIMLNRVEATVTQKDLSSAQKAEIESLVQQGKDELNDLQTYVDARNYGQAKQSLNDVHILFKEIHAKLKEYAGGEESLRAIAGAPRASAPAQDAATMDATQPVRIPRDRVSTRQISPEPVLAQPDQK